MIFHRLTTFISALEQQIRFVIHGVSPYDSFEIIDNEPDDVRSPTKAARPRVPGPAAVWGTYWHP
jgi:hypothetical protein